LFSNLISVSYLSTNQSVDVAAVEEVVAEAVVEAHSNDDRRQRSTTMEQPMNRVYFRW
jgi:hypothetical protein